MEKPLIDAPEEKFRPEIPNRAFNLWELSQEERRVLSERIEANKGLIRIFVHPFFEVYNYPESYFEEPDFHDKNPRVKIVETVLQRILEKKPEKTPPVIVLEEQKNLNTTGGYLSFFAKESGNPSYLVPTREMSPVSKMTPPGVRDETASPEAWRKLTGELWDLGVRRAIVGGMYLKLRDRSMFPKEEGGEELKKEWDKLFESYRRQRERQGAVNTDYYLSQCAGWTVGELSRAGIETEISIATHPHSRREIREEERGGGGD